MICSGTGKRGRVRNTAGTAGSSRPGMRERFALAMLLVIGLVTVILALWSLAVFIGLAGPGDPLEKLHHLLP